MDVMHVDIQYSNSLIKYLWDWVEKLQSNKFNNFENRGKLIENMKQLLQEFEQAREFDLREIADYIHDGIFLADSTGKAIYVNEAYIQITGIKAEDIIGKHVAILEKEGIVKNAVTPKVLRMKRQVNSIGESTHNENKILISGNPVFDERGKIKKVVVIDRDITELLAMKAELEATQSQIKAVEKNKARSELEVRHLRKQHFSANLIGQSFEFHQLLRTINQIADVDVTTLITGETGTGKEVVANEIHLNSYRKDYPYIKINCSAIPSALLESELFGYEKGAFTGASSSGKQGMFVLADKGTLLLDEIGDMPIELQKKLLRVIQYKEVTPVGGTRPVKIDVRILSSTNRNLKELVRQGIFREDLYYRLNVFPIHIPPLRERVEDIEVLACHFLHTYNIKYGKFIEVKHSGMDVLKNYSWPGNVRELQNILERLVIIAKESTVNAEGISRLLNFNTFDVLHCEMSLKEIQDEAAKQAIKRALLQCGSTRKAAKLLKTDQAHIVRKSKRLGLNINEIREYRQRCHQGINSDDKNILK